MRVDVHAHLWSDEYLDLLDKHGYPAADVHRGLGAGTGGAELEARFELMASAGIDMQVLSTPPGSPHFATEADAVDVAQRVNDEYAEIIRRHPDRFRALASLPFPHTDAALTELTRAIDDLGMLGAAITTSVLGRSVDDPAMLPVYAELDRRGSVLYVHPAGAGAGSPLINNHLTWSIGAPVEDTVAIMHLILAGIPSRFPNMRIIASHLGGALPMVLERVDRQVTWEAPDTPEKPSVAARRMWFDTVAHDHVPALRAAVESLGADRFVLGTDFPYQGGEAFGQAVTYVRRAGLSAEDTAAILDRNAADVLFT
jgi:predicted TIM-barrel fold metal-dependent hydrolase